MMLSIELYVNSDTVRYGTVCEQSCC